MLSDIIFLVHPCCTLRWNILVWVKEVILFTQLKRQFSDSPTVQMYLFFSCFHFLLTCQVLQAHVLQHLCFFFFFFFAADSELLGSVMKNERGHFQMEIKPLIYLQFQFYFVSPTWKWFQYNFNCTLRPICLPSNYILYKTFQWHFKLPTNLNWTQLARSSLPEM